MTERRVLTLKHEGTERRVPIDVPTVIGRSDAYYRYTEDDERPDRLDPDAVERLARLNYIKLCSEKGVSRTHGLIDPCAAEGPVARDLSSTNGTYVNGRRLAAGAGDAGPPATLRAGDRLTVAKATFTVELQDVAASVLAARIQTQRRAVVAADDAHAPRARDLVTYLTERKGFSVRGSRGWPATIAAVYQLQAEAQDEGVAVLTVVGQARGDELVLEGEGLPLAKLLPLLARIPGRKVLALESDGDPSSIERIFAQLAFEDMLLLTVTGATRLADSFRGSIATSGLEQMKKSVSGESPALRGAFDQLEDGLDALLAADTNALEVAWVKSYVGRLKLAFGDRRRGDDAALSHSLRLGSTTYRF